MATKLRDRVDVRLLRLPRQIAECHILDHASAKRAHLGHRGLLCSEGWVRQPHLLTQEASLQPASGSAPGDSSRTAGSFNRLSPHPEHELALQVTRLADPQCLGGIRKAVERHRWWANGPSQVKLDNAVEMRSVAADGRSQGGHVAAIGLRRLCPGGNEGGAPAWLENRERAQRHVAA